MLEGVYLRMCRLRYCLGEKGCGLNLRIENFFNLFIAKGHYPFTDLTFAVKFIERVDVTLFVHKVVYTTTKDFEMSLCEFRSVPLNGTHVYVPAFCQTIEIQLQRSMYAQRTT